MKWNNQKKERFLELLREGTPIIEAAKRINMVPSGVYKRRYSDPVFDQEWAEALAFGEKVILDRLEQEADRRGVEGYLKPVYYNGVAVGAERRYSDVLLIIRMKALAPHKYKDRPVEDASAEDEDFNRFVDTAKRYSAHKQTFKPNGRTNGNGRGNGS